MTGGVASIKAARAGGGGQVSQWWEPPVGAGAMELGAGAWGDALLSRQTRDFPLLLSRCLTASQLI